MPKLRVGPKSCLTVPGPIVKFFDRAAACSGVNAGTVPAGGGSSTASPSAIVVCVDKMPSPEGTTRFDFPGAVAAMLGVGSLACR
jgi:hypothetical protein